MKFNEVHLRIDDLLGLY